MEGLGMKDFKNVYFIGIGGIGMSALARHFNTLGYAVAGYDRTQTKLTDEIESEGIKIVFDDNEQTIAEPFRNAAETIVVYTPAIPRDNKIMQFFANNGFEMVKRAAMLGVLTQKSDAICIAGTHGKTTTSTLTAHILRNSQVGCSAFLGGISSNYDTNYWSNTQSSFVVTEADEYDRSFLQLHPYLSVITAMDADHLDIYGNKNEVVKAFRQYAGLTTIGGSLVHKLGLPLSEKDVDEDVELFSYSVDNADADFYAFDIRLSNGRYKFNIMTPFGAVRNVVMGLPGRHNVENAVAACALAMLAGAEEDEVREAMKTFKGNRRRFDYKIEEKDVVLIDDYAHHPEEIRTMLTSVREMYDGRKITVVFQPHLYTRTRDFADGFAKSLSLADRVLLLDIYPARELPIEGVTSQLLADKMKNTDVSLTTKETLLNDLLGSQFDVIVMMGAGNIDALVPVVEKRIREIKSL
ncbi:MAG: UDP-N-acetylmuramate--L-alanine ligase [Bacteroidales bacterium]|nr:UDP-N-acetylmuramate--L-alanine ligase [Bacteroidales bacterium]